MSGRQTSPGPRRVTGDATARGVAMLACTTLSFTMASAASAWPRQTPGLGHQVGPIIPIAVFGRDDRTSVPPAREATARKVGTLINRQARTICTAFCLSPTVIATAGHCLYRTSGERPPRLEAFSFGLSVGAKNRARLAGATHGHAKQSVVAGSTKLSLRPPIDAARDWAILRLASPACESGGLPISRRSMNDIIAASEAGRVWQVGYHRDRPGWKPTLSSGCRISPSAAKIDAAVIVRDFNNPDHVMMHDCDTGGASSGSPLLLEGPNGPEVIGINVGTYVQSKVRMRNGKVVDRLQSIEIANTAAAAAAFAAAADLMLKVEPLIAVTEVRQLQARLAASGYYRGPRDGIAGRRLRTAIEHAERALNLPVTGLATRALLKTLESSEVPAATSARAVPRS